MLAIILHEVSHGYAALALGDDTAKRLGRLSLNPLVHVDRVGTIIVPGDLSGRAGDHSRRRVVLRLGQAGADRGVAVPQPAAGHDAGGAAGPLANYVLAYLAVLALHLTPALPHLAAGLCADLSSASS